MAREHAGLPPLPPARSPPRFDDLPSLFDTDTEEDKEEEQKDNDKDLDIWGDTMITDAPHHQTLHMFHTTRYSTRSTRFTSTTHRQGRARIDSNNDDDGNGGGAARGGDGIDWENI